jgi:selenocysteine-specific elongation factor
MKTVIVGTAGHIDHGKSELVRALTGTHPDRLPEERQRGITIDLGFASLERPGLMLSFIDVPGHERFIKNMMAGASGIDLVLLVVACDESVRPQTSEHFAICRLLGLRRGVVALTKADLVDEDLRGFAALEVRDLVRGSFLERAPIVPVSSRTGQGIGALIDALVTEAGSVEPRLSSGSVRLPVDRSFSVKGFGAVVTGTLLEGKIEAGAGLDLLPAGRRVKVRGIETQGRAVPEVRAGQRAALNLQGVSHHDVRRGDLLATPGVFAPTSIFDARVSLLPDAPAEIEDLTRVRLHAGTSEVLARIRPLGRARIGPGESALAQLRLERPAVVVHGDRFILRRYSPPTTIGGGVALDPFPDKHRRNDPQAEAALAPLEDPDPVSRAKALVAGAGARGVDPTLLARRCGLAWAEIQARLKEAEPEGSVLTLGAGPDLVISREGLEEAARSAEEILRAFHAERPLQPGLPLEELRSRLSPGMPAEASRALADGLAKRGRLRFERDVASLPGHQVHLAGDEERMVQALVDLFRGAGLTPPELKTALSGIGVPGEKGEALVAHLLREGVLLRLRDGQLFHRDAVEDLRARLRAHRAKCETIDVAAFKEIAGVSRKHAIPLLEYLDAQRVTLRRGNDRVILP